MLRDCLGVGFVFRWVERMKRGEMCVEYLFLLYIFTQLVCAFLTLCGGNTISLSFTYELSYLLFTVTAVVL
jgi:hypothetical protein